MALEHYYGHEWKPVSATTTETEDPKTSSGCFECNICLDFACEPIVTLCGHLYCWPCIFKWLHVQSASLASDEHPQCPVCKTDICHTEMIPLYGRGHANSAAPTSLQAPGTAIPPRPSACIAAQALSAAPRPGVQQLPYRNPYQQGLGAQQFGGFGSDEMSHPTTPQPAVVGMFGGLVYARVFGNSEGYDYPINNSYRLMGSSTPRLRRQELHVDKSLNRISIFLFCCLLLCLVVF